MHRLRGTATGAVRGHVLWEDTLEAAPNARGVRLRRSRSRAALRLAGRARGGQPGGARRRGPHRRDRRGSRPRPVRGRRFPRRPAARKLPARGEERGGDGDVGAHPGEPAGRTGGRGVAALPAPARGCATASRTRRASGCRPSSPSPSLDGAGQRPGRRPAQGLPRRRPARERQPRRRDHGHRRGEVEIEPGRYQITVSRGIEYGIYVERDVTLAPGRTLQLDATLVREVDTRGGCRPTCTSTPSRASTAGMALPRRVATVAAEGVGSSRCRPTTTSRRTTSRQRARSGSRLTSPRRSGRRSPTLEQGHFIGFPLEYDELDVPATARTTGRASPAGRSSTPSGPPATAPWRR